MKKITSGLVTLMIFLPIVSFAQTNSQTSSQTPATKWLAYIQQKNAQQAAFSNQMKADRDAFLQANPDLNTYVPNSQTNPQVPAALIAFQQQDRAKRMAFDKKWKSDRDAFLQANPDVKTYIDQMHAQIAALRATKKKSTNSADSYTSTTP